jgi:hypothetical protein
MLLLFLPSLSYWSGALGKDAISFFAVNLLIFAVAKGRNKKLLITLAIIVMFLVRPHVGFIMILSYLAFFVVKANLNLAFKLLILPAFIISAIFSFNFVSNYAGLEENSLEDAASYIEYRQTLNQEGGSSIDMRDQSFPVKVFTYFFRPMPFEAHNFIALVASIENLILLAFFIYLLTFSKNKIIIFSNYNFLLFIYVVALTILLANIVTNLGIASRQKWMVLPVLFYLSIYAFNSSPKVNNLNLLRRS